MYKIAAVVAPEVTRPSIATTLSLSTSLLKACIEDIWSSWLSSALLEQLLKSDKPNVNEITPKKFFIHKYPHFSEKH